MKRRGKNLHLVKGGGAIIFYSECYDINLNTFYIFLKGRAFTFYLNYYYLTFYINSQRI